MPSEKNNALTPSKLQTNTAPKRFAIFPAFFQKRFLLARTLGLRWVLFRIRYSLLKKTGTLKRRTPLRTWESVPNSFDTNINETHFVEQFPLPPLSENSTGKEKLLAEAEAVVQGDFLLFGWHRHKLGRFPQWNKSPLDGSVAPCDKHWSEISDFGFGDIKNIWELSRWRWAFVLAQSWRLEKNEKLAERFWELTEDWIEKNPPAQGVNWKCGQEASFRLFAAVFARIVFDRAQATTPARLQQWRRLVWATGERVAGNLEYALSQKNNHGLSECVGLLTAGLLVGGETGDAWVTQALAALEQQLQELVYADGGFSQHSAVYHRVATHDLIWATWVLRAAGKIVPEWLAEAGKKLTCFMAELSDKKTGAAHLYGASDGSDILPLDGLEYSDFSSAVRLGTAAFLQGEAGQAGAFYPEAGVALLRSGEISLLLRCSKAFRHRPSHADLLHLSALWRGAAVLLSPGSFSYNPPQGQFSAGFSGAETHNTATLSGVGQMEKFSRFLYLPWPRGAARQVAENTFEAEHFSWKNRFGATHRRRVTLHSDGTGFTVEDFFDSGFSERGWRLHWLLADGTLNLNGDGADLVLAEGHGGCSLRWECKNFGDTAPIVAPVVTAVRGEAAGVRGWWSPHYFEAVPAWSLALELGAARQGVVRTVFLFRRS
ncbi:MAG: heparinase II/III family protein [Puniceicoccales bacterium]|nr:heparinase II/III family protein [Puniceicoccales bacterium]